MLTGAPPALAAKHSLPPVVKLEGRTPAPLLPGLEPTEPLRTQEEPELRGFEG